MQNCKLNIIKTAMSFLLIVVFLSKLKAQEQATSFLKDYYPIAVFGQYTKSKAGIVHKEDPSVNYDILSNVLPEYGILVNVYQTNNWNFKTGFIIKPQMISTSINFTKEQTGFDSDYSFTTHSSGDDSILSIPLTVEYIIPINKQFKWMIAPSITMSYYRYFGGDQLNSRRASIFTIDDDRSDKTLHTSAEISTGFYILFRHFMLQPEFRYSKSFTTIKTGSFTTENFRTTPNSSTGSYKITGDYWGLSLSIFVKKRGKNKKRKGK